MSSLPGERGFEHETATATTLHVSDDGSQVMMHEDQSTAPTSSASPIVSPRVSNQQPRCETASRLDTKTGRGLR